MAALPAYALLLFDGYTERPDPAVKVTEMEDGMKKQLRTKSRAMVSRPAKLLLRSNADYLSFKTWFDTDAEGGAAWWDFADPADSVTKLAHFAGGKVEYTPTRKGMSRWIVGCEIETWGP